MDTYGIPELVVSPISQVRLLEYPMLTPLLLSGGGVCAGRMRQFGICEAAVAGKAPQQPTSSGMMTWMSRDVPRP